MDVGRFNVSVNVGDDRLVGLLLGVINLGGLLALCWVRVCISNLIVVWCLALGLAVQSSTRGFAMSR